MRLFDFRMCQAWRARRYCFRILRFVSKSFQVTLFRNMLHISSFTWIFMSLTWMIRDSVKSTTLWRSDLLWTPIRNGIHSYYSLLIARKIVGKFDGSCIWKDDLEILVHCQTFLSFDLFDFFGRKCFFRPCWILSWAQISFFALWFNELPLPWWVFFPFIFSYGRFHLLCCYINQSIRYLKTVLHQVEWYSSSNLVELYC